jgi:predicted nucleic acid-binding protein
LIQLKANDAIVAIPEIADFEVRRGLLLAGAMGSLRRLDELRGVLAVYVPISTGAMRKAADLWADARRTGFPTADDKELDCDAILAAQALLFAGHGDRLVLATYNPRHFSRVLDARHWEAITS